MSERETVGRVQLLGLPENEERRLEGYGVAVTHLPGKVSLAVPAGSTLERRGSFLTLRVPEMTHVLTIHQTNYIGSA